MAVASRVALHTAVEAFPLAAANDALARLRSGAVDGAVALAVGGDGPVTAASR